MNDEFLAKNAVPVRPLRSFAGKASRVASAVYMLRPFLKDLWCAMSMSNIDSHAPVRRVWVKQVQHTLKWVSALCTDSVGH